MRIFSTHVLATLIALAPACLAQEWELGGAGGFGVLRDLTVTSQAGSAKTGFKSGAAISAIAGQNLYPHIGGEMRYTFRFSDLKVSGNGTEVEFSGFTHAIHYDLLIYAKRPGERVRPYVAGGGGIKVFRGTGEERAFQPLNQFALLTKTQEVKPLISVGGGVKIAVKPNVFVRVEFRDYITPFPKEVIAEAPGADLDGFLHDFVPLVGITFGF